MVAVAVRDEEEVAAVDAVRGPRGTRVAEPGIEQDHLVAGRPHLDG
jgi:hypothetical protein